MFEKFTPSAIRVIMLAQEEARRLGNNYVGTEQILAGLLGQRTGIAAKVLTNKGLTLEQVRTEIEAIAGRGSGFVQEEIPFTPRAKKLLELAWDESRMLGHRHIGTEHLLLGLLREADGVGSRILENLAVSKVVLREAVLELIEQKLGKDTEDDPSGTIHDPPEISDGIDRVKEKLIYWQTQLIKAHILEREARYGEKNCTEVLAQLESQTQNQ